MNQNGGTVPCHFCGHPLDPNSPHIYRRVKGWVIRGVGERRKSGRDVVLVEDDVGHPPACNICIDRAKRGIAPAQETLI